MLKNAYLLFILSICVFWKANAQEKNNPKNSIHHALTFHLLDVESGLSNNYINSLEEDDIGRIWIATSDGLNRYDGTTFEHFKTNNSKGLTNNNISSIQFDSKSRNLILATDDGINIYDPRLEVFKKMKSKTKTLSQVVNCFAKNKDGKLIISMLRSHDGLYIENDSKTFVPYWEVFGKHQLISSSEISCLAFQNDSVLWIGTFHSGLLKLNIKTNKLTNFSATNALFSNTINTLFIDKTQNIWVGTKEGLTVVLKNNETKHIKISDQFEKGLSDKNVLSIEEDNQGSIWIGTRNGGLNILNKKDFLTQSKLNIKWYLPKTDGTSVFNRTVSSIKKDRNGNMWLGTSTGVNFVNPKDEPVKLIQQSTTNTKGLSHNRIGSLALANNGEIWIGTDGGGLDLLNPSANTIKNFKHDPSNPQSLSNNFIISVFEDSKNRVWVGTYQGGVNLLNSKTGLSKKYLHSEDVRVIFEDQSHKIWVGTNRAGLFCYNDQKDHFEFVSTLGKIDIRDIKQGVDYSIWLATFGEGIIQYYPKTNKVLEYNTKTVKDLATDVFFSLEVLKDGTLLLGSRYEGLMLLNPSNKVISKFTEKDGLSNNSVVSILKENDEFYWLGTNNGINRYNVKNNKTFNLSTLNNIQTSAFNVHAAMRSKEGHLYFGGNKGLNIFYPERLKNAHEDYRLIFNELKVLNEPVDISSENAVLDKSISYADVINLQHHQSLFSVAYTVLKYPQNKNIVYSYILEGYHDQWIKSYGLGEANFSKTPPGKYILKVKANLDSGEEVMNQIAVIISPPFWQTFPAYFLYFILSLALFYFGMKYYSERIKLNPTCSNISKIS